MIKNYIFCLLSIILISTFWGCVGYTRVETDTYTISERDTTKVYLDKNAPGNRENGVIYPSSRVFKSERSLLQRDSVVDRFYPNFIRLGAFESIGLIGSGSANSFGTGMFGLFPDFTNFRDGYKGKSSYIFNGGIYRIGIGEWRLRWFRDAKNWTWGFHLLEFLAPDARLEKMLVGALPLYIRKRFFLREEIPYIALTPSFGFGYMPSQYLNISGSIDVGSLGGLNIRGYLGFVAGQNLTSSAQVRYSSNTGSSATSIFPYAGLGISVLDFLNIVPETEKEWKDHEHSAWDIGLLQFAFIKSTSDTSVYDSKSTLLTGYVLKLANASVAIPVLNNQFYAGTSLLNLMILGWHEFGIGILPIRVGYWQTVLADELSTEPFIEYNYYPSNFINIGNRLNLKITESLNLSLLLGFASGSTAPETFGREFTSLTGRPFSFSRPYIGLSIGLYDRIFYPQDLRYNRK